MCPRCRLPLSSPVLAQCPHCGQTVNPVTSPKLLQHLADGTVLEHPLDLPRVTLGRHPQNTVKLLDREVSKEHAGIERGPEGYVLKDLGSSNGTFVNGQRIREVLLADGDKLAFGNSNFTFRCPEQPPKPHVSQAAGVTVVASSAHSAPAFLAQMEQRVEADEFRAADRISDIAELRQDYEKLRIAHELHRLVGQERDFKGILEKILDVVFNLLKADNGVIFVAEDEGRELKPLAKRHRKATEQEVVLSDTVLQRVLQTRQAILTADAIIDSRFSTAHSIVAQGIRSAMAVPLLAKDNLKGILFIDSRQRTNAFSEKDLKILSGIASQAAIALENAEMAQRIERDAVTRAELSRFLSPKVAEMVVTGQVDLLRQGGLAEVTVLFADIRGFTTLSESESPQELVSMLNSFFTSMAEVVFRHEGNLDKFIGDCVMAVWGPPSPHPDDKARALRAGLDMQKEIAKINEARAAAGKSPIQVGIGINSGQAVVGYMGSSDRHEFTAIGDSVNVAARLCGLAKGGEVLAAEVTVDGAKEDFHTETLPPQRVKGKEKGVPTYRVIGRRG
jgi:adenylate cyclase